MKSFQKRVDEIMAWPWRNEYRLQVIPEDQGGGLSLSVPLIGANTCIGEGDTFEEAEQNLLAAMEHVIEEHLKAGRAVPFPRSSDSFSGTFIVRATPDLHQRLIREAEGQGVSLNYLVGMLLERALAGEKPSAENTKVRAAHLSIRR
jgi:predicted HicB family RNase H-like nuclease